MKNPPILYLSEADVRNVGLTMAEIVEIVETVFRAKGEGQTEMPPKPGIHPRQDAFIHAMPAYVPSLNAAGCKWVSGFPENLQQGLPYISGLLFMNDPETGLPLAVMDCTWVTAMRTGAATAVAARYLARPDSRTVGILGCGVQGRSNLEALSAVFPLQQVTAYDLALERSQQYSEEMHSQLGIEIKAVSEPRQAVAGRDIVVTAGPIFKQPHATIKAGWLSPGTFASPVDFDSYWDGAALQEIDFLCTDDLSQMAYYRESGYFRQTPAVQADLGDLVCGKVVGRQDAQARTMSINLGIALEDVAVGIQVYQRACEKNIGVWLDA